MSGQDVGEFSIADAFAGSGVCPHLVVIFPSAFQVLVAKYMHLGIDVHDLFIFSVIAGGAVKLITGNAGLFLPGEVDAVLGGELAFQFLYFGWR